MFEVELRNKLIADAILISYVSTYKNTPAIFNVSAPEGKEFPYVTFYIRKVPNDLIIDEFTIMIDFWDYGDSWKKANDFAKRLELILDFSEVNTDELSNIRIRQSSGTGPILEPDPKAIHFNCQYRARAGRKAFIENMVNN